MGMQKNEKMPITVTVPPTLFSSIQFQKKKEEGVRDIQGSVMAENVECQIFIHSSLSGFLKRLFCDNSNFITTLT
jgi:hypothetical protein